MQLTIITINYNNAEGLEKTILSVINQTFKDYEYIIIDGGSTDGSVEVIKKYEKNISYWLSEPDNGVYYAMNKGINCANGDYLNFLNSGDTYFENNTLLSIKKHLNYDIIAGKWSKDNKIINDNINDDITMLDLFTNTPNHQATFIKKKLFKNRKYDETYKVISDWIFFVESIVYMNCTYKNIEEIIVDYDGLGISSNAELRLNERETYLKTIFPPRIYRDYCRLVECKKSVLYKHISGLSETRYSFQLLVERILSIILYLYHIIIKLFKVKIL